MKYYRLAIAGEGRWHYEVDGAVAPLDVTKCEYVTESPRMRFRVSVNGIRVDFGHTGWAGIPVVSKRMAECIQRVASADIQRIAAEVEGERSGEWEVLNIVARPDCIDHDRSQMTYYPAIHPRTPSKPRGVIRLVLDPNRIGDHQVFRPMDWEVVLVVSDVVRLALQECRVSGVEFWPVTV